MCDTRSSLEEGLGRGGVEVSTIVTQSKVTYLD
jgi:hypothetical protein